MAEKYTLNNGLTVYADPKSIGKCGVYLIVNAGMLNNVIHETAHVVEHLQASAAGFSNSSELKYTEKNAVTTPRSTVYFFTEMLPKHLPIALRKIKAVLERANVDVLEREQTAIINELKPRHNPTNILLTQRSENLLFPNLSRKIGGIEERLVGVTKIDERTIKDFWEAHYTPANAVLYIAGELSQPLETLVAGFEEIPARGKKSEPVILSPEPELKERVEIKEMLRSDNTTSILMLYKAPEFPKEWDAKKVLAGYLLAEHLELLDGPLMKRLREELKLCYGVNVGYSSDFGNGGQFSFGVVSGIPDAEKVIENEWIKCLLEISKKGISETDLEAFRNKSKINKINREHNFDLDSFTTEFQYGVKREEFIKALEQMTSEDIANIAGYFAEKPHVISIALPKQSMWKRIINMGGRLFQYRK